MPMRSSCSRIAGTASAASGVLTVMRTSSEPACASSLTWMAVPMTSAVSVLVMDCTRTGAPPPTVTTREPQTTRACSERRGAASPSGMGWETVMRSSWVRWRSGQFEGGDVVARRRGEVHRLPAPAQAGALGVADLHAQRRGTVDAHGLAGGHHAGEDHLVGTVADLDPAL